MMIHITENRKTSHNSPCVYAPVTPSMHPQFANLVLSDDAVPDPLGLLFTGPNGLEVLLYGFASFHIQN